MKTSCAIRVQEIDGKKCGVGKEEIIISSHWNYKRELVVIEINGQKFTLLADALIASIENCKRTV